MKSPIFITGIGTDVGKTIVAAIVCEALAADYWKPIQAGDLACGDTQKVQNLISHPDCHFHPNSYALTTAVSPHWSAQIDGIDITLQQIKRPKTTNRMVIEGAGGLMVPLNDQRTILDLIQPNDQVIVVSRHYLGSINHTLMTLHLLQQKGIKPAVIFNGNELKSTEEVIQKMSGVQVIGRINEEQHMNADCVKKYAHQFKSELLKL